MAPKLSISAPLEAGSSLLDTHNLSTTITDALDYVSGRLIRKKLHLTLILTHDDVALPMASAAPSPCIPQSPMSPRSPLSPVANFFRRRPQAPSPILEMPAPMSPIICQFSPVTPRSPMTPGGLFSHPVNTSHKRHSRNRSLPTTPRIPPSPMQLGSPRLPSSPFLSPDYIAYQRSNSSCSSDSSVSAQSTGSVRSASSTASTKPSVKLIPATQLAYKDRKVLKESIEKASHKHGVTMELSSTSATLIRQSLQQNRLIHTSEGLTVLSLDRIYTLKLALARYTFLSSTRSTASNIQESLAAAVDELRLAVWSQRREGIEKSFLLRSYDHLPISLQALRDVNGAYTAVTGKAAPILSIAASPPLTMAPPTGPLPSPVRVAEPSAPRVVRRWHTVKDKENVPPQIMKVMRKSKHSAADRRRGEVLLESKPAFGVLAPMPPILAPKDGEGVQIRDLFAAIPTIKHEDNVGPNGPALPMPMPMLKPVPRSQPHMVLKEARTKLLRPQLTWLNTEVESRGSMTESPVVGREMKLLHSFRRKDSVADRKPGPKTPGGWEDCTPITKNEWSFFIGEQEPKRGGVEMC